MKDRQLVFLQAKEIQKNTGKGFNLCLSTAWHVYRLKKAMLKSEVFFTFRKVSGEIRPACGKLLNNDILFKDIKALHYFDLYQNEYRSFKPENLLVYHINGKSIKV